MTCDHCEEVAEPGRWLANLLHDQEVIGRRKEWDRVLDLLVDGGTEQEEQT